MNLVVRTSGDPSRLAAPVRAAIADLDPSLTLLSTTTMDALRDASLARTRFLTMLMLMFGAIGVLLAVVGVYGVLAQVSRSRTREMGIRVALGAPASEVRWLVVRQGLTLTAIGLITGGAVAHEATRAMSKLLFEVQPNDPLTLWSVATLLALTSLAAAWLPARRASRADPVIALRAD